MKNNNEIRIKKALQEELDKLKSYYKLKTYKNIDSQMFYGDTDKNKYYLIHAQSNKIVARSKTQDFMIVEIRELLQS